MILVDIIYKGSRPARYYIFAPSGRGDKSVIFPLNILRTFLLIIYTLFMLFYNYFHFILSGGKAKPGYEIWHRQASSFLPF